MPPSAKRSRPCWPLILVGAAALSLACHRFGRGRGEIFALEDPAGDSFGAGDLVYPLRPDVTPGSLDLVSFSARADPQGTWFSATFARPIPIPDRRAMSMGGTTLDTLARLGFFTLNVDVYIDMDHVPGSGQVAMLPGRAAQVDARDAWEKAIVLTPRPFEARDELRRIWIDAEKRRRTAEGAALDPRAVSALEAAVGRRVESQVFFPSQVRVSGPTIGFFVPNRFLGGPAEPTWGYVVGVSAADLEEKVNVPAALGLAAPPSKGLMILEVGAVPTEDRFGGARVGGAEPALVDILVPEGRAQAEILRGDPRTGAVMIPAVVPLRLEPSPGADAGEGEATPGAAEDLDGGAAGASPSSPGDADAGS